MFSRREIGTLTLAGLAAPVFGGLSPVASRVRLGVQTFSFRGLPPEAGIDAIETLIGALAACGVGDCELFAPQVEAQFGGPHRGHHGNPSMTPQMMRRELRKWRLRTPLSYFGAIRTRFERAGIRIGAYNFRPDASFTDQEIDRGFAVATALGAELVTASTTLDTARRVAPLAAKHGMVVAIQCDARVAPNELAAPPGLAAALAISKYFKVSLDLGCLTAANVDAVAYIRQHHRDIATVRLNDWQKTQGENVPWGQGDAPIREVLRLLKHEGWPIRAQVMYDYAGRSNPTDEVKKCLAYAAEALA